MKTRSTHEIGQPVSGTSETATSTLLASGPGFFDTFDWAGSPLGPPDTWPAALQQASQMIRFSPQPMALFWGPTRLMLYNQAFSALLGDQHPAQLGQPLAAARPETVALHSSAVQRAGDGQAVTLSRQPMHATHNGQASQRWFDLNYSPFSAEGVLLVASDITPLVEAEREAQLNNQRLQIALSVNNIVGSGEHDFTRGVMYCDSHLAELFGFDPEAAAHGLPVSAFFQRLHPEDTAQIYTMLSNQKLSPDQKHEYRLIDASGAVRWLTARGLRLANGQEASTRYFMVVSDITEQKQSEQALRESKQELQLITDELPELVGYVDSGLIYRFVNRTYAEWFQKPLDQILGHHASEMVDAEAYAVREPLLRRALAGEASSLDAELVINGYLRNTEIRFFPRFADDGSVQGVYIFVIDVSDRIRTEQNWRERSQGLEEEVAARTRERDKIWSVSQDMLGVADENGVWLNINPAWQRTLGWREDQILGQTSEWMEHPSDRERTRNEIGHLAGGQPTMSFENRFRTAEGGYRWLSWRAIPQDGLLYCVARDITDEKAQQAAFEHVEEQLRQAQKMEAVGQLTGGIAHDFNNLLTGILSSLDLMQRRLKANRTDDIERYITVATTSARRAASLTHRLLAFSRRQSLDIKAVAVHDLVVSLEDLVRRSLGENIQLQINSDAHLWTALTDANQLENALLNLCINARDAMPDGGTLTIATANYTHAIRSPDALDELAPGDYVRIEIADTGTGMPATVIARAFDPFFTTKPIGQGTGLGLSMVYGFAKQSGGLVEIDSHVDQGTTISLYLPRHQHASAAEHPPAEAATALAGEGEMVLVVEDDVAVRMVILEVLGDLGYRSLEAFDAPSAMVHIEQNTPIDLLVTDVGLPGTNGRQLAEMARQRRPDLPVLFVTGYAEGATIRGGFLGTGMEMITKPFEIDILAAKVREMIIQNRRAG